MKSQPPYEGRSFNRDRNSSDLKVYVSLGLGEQKLGKSRISLEFSVNATTACNFFLSQKYSSLGTGAYFAQ